MAPLFSQSNAFMAAKIIDISMTVITIKLTNMRYFKTESGLRYAKIYCVHGYSKRRNTFIECRKFTSFKKAKEWEAFAKRTFPDLYTQYLINIEIVWVD